MPILRSADPELARLRAELERAIELARAWDTLAAAGAPVARKQREARALVRDLEEEMSHR